MANEVTIRSSLTVRKLSGSTVLLQYQSQPSAYLADMDGTFGPSPGALQVDNDGTDVDLSQFTTPGFCYIQNLSDEGYIEYGIYDPELDIFYPIGECLPGEGYVFRFSRNILEQYGPTGTGTTAATNRFRVKGVDGATAVLVAAFER